MPINVEVKYEYFMSWEGRIKVIELVLGILCMACCAPAYYSTQHWFLLVVVSAFIGTLFYSIYHLAADTYLKDFNVNWAQMEFWFTALMTFLYFTAFVAQLADFAGITDKLFQYWYDAQVSAGVFALFNDIAYGIGTYFIYLEWKAGPSGTSSSPMPPV